VRRAWILPALMPFLLACTIPVMRPMRTHEGPEVTAWHVFVVGLDANLDSLKAFFPSLMD
jgi:hypothetical protein